MGNHNAQTCLLKKRSKFRARIRPARRSRHASWVAHGPSPAKAALRIACLLSNTDTDGKDSEWAPQLMLTIWPHQQPLITSVAMPSVSAHGQGYGYGGYAPGAC